MCEKSSSTSLEEAATFAGRRFMDSQAIVEPRMTCTYPRKSGAAARKAKEKAAATQTGRCRWGVGEARSVGPIFGGGGIGRRENHQLQKGCSVGARLDGG